MRLIVTELLLSILRKAGVGGPYSANALFTDIKRKISRVLAAAILLAFVNLWISTAIYVMVAILIPIVGTRTFFGKPVSRIVVKNFSKLCLALFVFLLTDVSVRAESAPCQPVTYEHSEYTVCEVDLRRQSVKLFWKKPDRQPYEYLSSLPRALANRSQHLLFATNGGMYHPDTSPVGLYVEDGRELVRANTSAGPGNFHMRPNGVFYVTGDVGGILETRAFIKQKPQVDFATQSEPMLVIEGEVNARFARYGVSKRYRVGVGSRDRNLVVFAVSESEVLFDEFARLFRDKLRCRNALFLDGGSATSFYSPLLGRNSNLLPLGPMIGVYGAD